MNKQKVIDSIRTVPDYPKPGILFYDVTTLVRNKEVFGEVIDFLKKRYEGQKIDFIAGIESRGFIFGAALAYALNIGFIPIRKKGKLPFTTISEKYSLEYGFDELEIHIDAFENVPNARVVLIDDLIVTGGSAQAGLNLIKSAGAQCIEAAFIVNLSNFDGVEKLKKSVEVFCVTDV
ncbi:adenine phosphoribosyltransferase [Helicobacter himalayensis]|uniref:adenine phosphoribosyltransferase n=1 Tax=Helicobacter himalayensis TaxID=1591088 RepID=UPI00082DC2F8|nr:adenine phosphoribosyltransferase [Helicobacter himalayensis]